MAGREVYEFAGFTLDAAERRLAKGSQCIPLELKTHNVLMALVRRAGRLVPKRELLELVWPESFVEEGILAVHISILRKTLGEGKSGRQFVETVPRVGYRFIAAVRQLNPEYPPAPTKQWSVA